MFFHFLTQPLVRGVRQRATDAFLSLVEAFYGNESGGDNIAHVHAAAEHSRYAMCAAVSAPDQAPLFGWLGITNPAQSEDAVAEGLPSQALAFDNGETPPVTSSYETMVASSSVREDNVRPLPSPATIWGPLPPRQYAPLYAPRPPHVLTRKISVVSTFGSQQLGDSVFTWLARTEGTRRRLHRQMVSWAFFFSCVS